MVAISIEKVELKATNDRFSHQTVRIGTSENNDIQNNTNTAISIIRQYYVYTIYTHIHVSDTYTYNIIIYIYIVGKIWFGCQPSDQTAGDNNPVSNGGHTVTFSTVIGHHGHICFVSE